MKKLIIIGAGSFVGAAAIGTVLGIVLAPPHPPAAGHETHAAAVDSTQTHPIDTAPDISNLHSDSHAAEGGDDAEPHAAVPDEMDWAAALAKAASAEENDAASDRDGAGEEEAARPPAEPAPAPAASPAASPAANPAPARPAKEPEGDAREFKQLAKILVNMKPADASRLIAGLPDDKVEKLLLAMGPRQAASVLAELPPERAAALGLRMLGADGEDRP